MDRLKGKVAAITGAARGIGRATATRMAEEGAGVALFDVVEDEGAALAAELSERGLAARFWRCDVSRESDVEGALRQAVDHFGRLDVMVNNAGVSGENKPPDELTEAEWDFVQSINVKGVFFGVKHSVPHLRRAGGGSIINLSSIYGLVGSGTVTPYHASKGAVRLMSKNDALIYAPEKIRVNSIHPGFIWTPMTQVADEETLKTLDALHPLGKMGEADDIAWGAVFLASEEAKFITGTELVIDGGYTAR